MSHDWFALHLGPDKARSMTREQYYATRSWLRRVRHIMNLRHIHTQFLNDDVMIIPAVEQVLPEKF